jgi:6-pyruvoyltetrahydropterin/6-carboxytetrahydropterin synthase
MKANTSITCKKRFSDYPFSHRQPRHDGHCAWLHGHNWDFEIEFSASELDDNGFVIDFGKMAFIKEFLTKYFDHTFVIPEDDAQIHIWEDLCKKNLIDLKIVPDASAEGLAVWIMNKVNDLVMNHTNNRVHVSLVTVWEDSKNSATCHNNM